MTEPLRLNHLYRVVDRETFAAARDSAWLREVFAPSELRTTHRPDWSYTGLYCYGTSGRCVVRNSDGANTSRSHAESRAAANVSRSTTR